MILQFESKCMYDTQLTLAFNDTNVTKSKKIEKCMFTRANVLLIAKIETGHVPYE